MIRVVRQGNVRATRERWLLWGVVKIITHPLPLLLAPASPDGDRGRDAGREGVSLDAGQPHVG